MSWYFGRRREFTKFDAYILIAVCLGIYIYHLFEPKQYMHCIKTVGCNVYSQENSFARKNLQYKFKPKAIESYEVKKTPHRHHKRHGGSRTNIVYSPVIILKDGSKLDLFAFEFGSKYDVDAFMVKIQTKGNFKQFPPSALKKLLIR